MAIQTKTITEDQLMQLEADDRHFEVIDGQLVELDPTSDGYGKEMTGEQHGWIEAILLHAIMQVVLEKKLGRVYPGDTSFVLDGEPGNIQIMRKPDIGFVKSENIVSSTGYIYRAPDLAVEVILPSERPGTVQGKLRDYFTFGTQQVWLIYPEKQQIVVQYPDGTAKMLNLDETLHGGDLLPGFALELMHVFEV